MQEDKHDSVHQPRGRRAPESGSVSEALENGGEPTERLAALARPMLAQPTGRFCAELLDAVHGVAHHENVQLDDWTVLAFKTED